MPDIDKQQSKHFHGRDEKIPEQAKQAGVELVPVKSGAELALEEARKVALVRQMEAQTVRDSREKEIVLARLSNIAPLEKMTYSDKFYIRLKSFLKIKGIALSLAAAVGGAGGYSVQKVERGITGYDPAEHKEFVNKRERSSSQGQEKKEEDLQSWLNGTFETLKKSNFQPKEFIKNTETYKTILDKYYAVLEVIDQTAFIAPALLLFIMLGGYISRKLEGVEGDQVVRADNQRVLDKINELVAQSNQMYEMIEAFGEDRVPKESYASLVEQLRQIQRALPSAEEIDGK